jgi:putative toxin-antitoxin system antitoxin component (TIGR02293 family)
MRRTPSQSAAAQSHSIGAIRKGLPTSRLDRMAGLLGIDSAALIEILGVSARTIERKRTTDAKLSPAVSDRLARIGRIFRFATEVLGDSSLAAKWLKRPSRALGNHLPLRLLDTDAGTHQVEQELLQIQNGFVF